MSVELDLSCPYLSHQISPFFFHEKPHIFSASTQLSFSKESKIQLRFSNGKHLTFSPGDMAS